MNNHSPLQGSLELNTAEDQKVSVEKYEFEPIKGYPMLSWRGKRPFTSTQFYPAQLKEIHGDEVDGWRNKIYWGDNLQVMSHLLKEFRGKVDLVYIDPPFDSKADYKRKISVYGKAAIGDRNSFEEKEYRDIWTNDEYLQFMYERLALIRELLSEKGVLYLHCDHRKVHHLNCILAEVFGENRFLNQIIWRRQIPRGMKVYAEHYAFCADYLLIYSKSDSPTWNRQVKSKVISIDEAHAKYQHDKLGFFRTSDPGTYSFQSLIKLHENGRLYAPHGGDIIIDHEHETISGSNGGGVSVKYYREECAEGVIEETTVDNIWDDIPGMGIVSSESIGYPTQKPEKLLERVLNASCNPGDLVFDCFMGSGTTQAVAMKLGRRFIGADINLGAVQTTTKRLIKIGNELQNTPSQTENKYYTGFDVYNVNNYDVFRNPVQAKELLMEALEIQKLEMSSVFDGEKDGRMVKIMPVNRIATRADLNELISGFDYRAWERRQNETPNKPVERITLYCMGHEADLKAQLELAVKPFKIDVEVVDILRDKAYLEFRRDSEAKVVVENGELIIERFYPMNLLQKLSMQKEQVEDWRELVESILIDWNYDGAVLQPVVLDIPGKNEMVQGRYEMPRDAGTIRVKITDLLSESWEGSVSNG